MLEHLERQVSLTAEPMEDFRRGDESATCSTFFDFYLIGFVLAFIIGGWHLTYGQSGAILLSSGIGAPIGSLFWGWMADKIGRRTVMILTVLNFTLATGADGADARARLAVPVGLPLLRRHGRDRPLHRRYRDRAGIRARL
jgi:putative MFS transporter